MSRGPRRAVTALLPALPAAALLLAACASGSAPAKPRPTDAAAVSPERILPAPRSLLAIAVPRASGITWGLAGTTSKGLYQLGGTGRADSYSVSGSAQSLADSGTGVLGLALGARRSGALELLDSRTMKRISTIALPAPARQVVAGRDGTTFYALTGWANSASVSVVSTRTSAHGRKHKAQARARAQATRITLSIPVPADSVSIAPSPAQSALYVLQANGIIDVIKLAGGRILSSFPVSDRGISLALSPDGSTLYVLKGTASVSNVAVIDIATQSVHRVLPAPASCRQVLVSASGRKLYEVVGTPTYGNIQVFAS